MAETKTKMAATRDGFGEGLLEAGAANKDVVVLSADLTDSTRAAWFKKKFPERFFGLGVAELLGGLVHAITHFLKARQ